jgi:hypothetical protein
MELPCVAVAMIAKSERIERTLNIEGLVSELVAVDAGEHSRWWCLDFKGRVG